MGDEADPADLALVKKQAHRAERRGDLRGRHGRKRPGLQNTVAVEHAADETPHIAPGRVELQIREILVEPGRR